MSTTETLDAPLLEALKMAPPTDKPVVVSDDGPCITTENGLVHLHSQSDIAYLAFAEAEEPLTGGLLSEMTVPENTTAQNEMAFEIVPIFDSNPDDFPVVDDAHNTHALLVTQ